MKRVLNQVSIGQRLPATIEEVVSNKNFIINFQGDLIRVSNKASRVLKVGQQVELEITSIKPLGFRLIDGSRRRGLDVSV